MTAIAAFRVHNVPIIIGDTLVSVEKPTERTFQLPGSGQNSSEIAEYVYPVELKQKVNVISDNLIIAWAGAKIVARTFVKELKTAMSSISSPSWEYVKGVMDRFDEENLNTDVGADFAYVFLYKNDKRSVIGGNHNAQEEQVEGYKGLVVAGSGSATLIDSLKGFEAKFSTENLASGILAAHAVISVITRLWRIDITSQANIRQGFGGGYEIGTVLPDGGLGKVGDILLAATEAHYTGIFGTNRRLAKLDYLDDYFIIRVLDFQGNPPQHKEESGIAAKFKDVKRRNFIIPPVDVNHLSVDIEALKLFERLPDWNAEYTGVQLDVFAENGKHLEATHTRWRPKRDGPITFKGEENYWTPEFVKEITKQADEFISLNSGNDDAV